MVKDLWMPLYIGDYLADTQLLNAEQHGAYLLIIMAYWKNGGPIPSDESILCTITRMPSKQWRKSRGPVLAFFREVDGKLVSKRVDAELVRAQKKRADASRKAQMAAQARWSGESEGGHLPPGYGPDLHASSIAPSNAPSNASHSYSHSHPKSPPHPRQKCDVSTGEIGGEIYKFPEVAS